MNSKNNDSHGPHHFDPNLKSFSKDDGSEIYGAPRKSTFRQHIPPAPMNTIPSATNNAIQFEHNAIAASLKGTYNMTLWLQQNNPDLLAQLSQMMNTQMPGLTNTVVSPLSQPSASKAKSPTLVSAPRGYATPNLFQQLPQFNRDTTKMAKKLKHWNLQLTDQLRSANQQLRSSHETIADLNRLLEQERDQAQHNRCVSEISSERYQVTNPDLDQYIDRFGTRQYEPATTTPSPTKGLSPVKVLSSPSTPTTLQPPSTPQHPPYRIGRRHHRTATPEQRSIRAMMGINKPVFTVGIDPQNDRCLLYDFFENIKQWAAAYTVRIRSLNAEQVHSLSAHSAIAEAVGKPSQLMMLVTEKDMLIAMVAAVISRHMWKYALDEHSLYASGHPEAVTCEELAWKWTTVPFNDHEAKHDLLLAQQQIYTAIKNAPDHKTWRTSCAEHLTIKLLADLDGLLAPNLSTAALTGRNHILSELYVKGYRIGFRLRMAATKWQFQWPSSGAEFNPASMVNESRLLYGDILRTMTEVMKDPRAHEVQFAVSPTVTRSDFSMGGEQRVVVHNALVHITRKGYL
ncbi:Nn.00g006730.m01.CDS01 [Neocucurbitaria sp. VM-36]